MSHENQDYNDPESCALAKLDAIHRELHAREAIVTNALWTELDLAPIRSRASSKWHDALDELQAVCRELRHEYVREFEHFRREHILSPRLHEPVALPDKTKSTRNSQSLLRKSSLPLPAPSKQRSAQTETRKITASAKIKESAVSAKKRIRAEHVAEDKHTKILPEEEQIFEWRDDLADGEEAEDARRRKLKWDTRRIEAWNCERGYSSDADDDGYDDGYKDGCPTHYSNFGTKSNGA